ncbi:transcriptional regulator, LacI family [Streptomyces zhaozhouensis]|uniref:Transcriptional regulator, LacI family n=1 Tax=Streptomyces zhaozhouensis TaxID=1300267 RepID=A0A286DXY0_9ACTN|nr:LacI family DNA-binding transcriptional regulator [Streptomyces zhaozhouensis]SOD63404.1 transcriptional regulator, LacI family [Streptomyces zhaozhouensis]
MPEQHATQSRDADRRPTIYEVARLAGVSHQTVSRFLRKDPTMRPDTARRVSHAVRELDYRPNLAARSMRTRRTNRIAVILPETTSFVPTRLLSGAAAAAHDAGYLVDVVGLEGDAAARAERIGALLQPANVDGILSFTPLAENLRPAPGAQRVPIVVDGEYDDNMRARALLADAKAADDIIGHLADLGHRTFVHVAGPRTFASAVNRRAEYEASVARRGLVSHAVVDGDWSAGSGWRAAREVIAGSPATAVFAANDRVAFGVIRGLQSSGVDVPGRVSVFGWDDDELGRYFHPPLSTVRVNRESQGRAAFQRLLSLLHGQEPAAPMDTAGLNHLIFRDSTAPPPAV